MLDTHERVIHVEVHEVEGGVEQRLAAHLTLQRGHREMAITRVLTFDIEDAPRQIDPRAVDCAPQRRRIQEQPQHSIGIHAAGAAVRHHPRDDVLRVGNEPEHAHVNREQDRLERHAGAFRCACQT